MRTIETRLSKLEVATNPQGHNVPVYFQQRAQEKDEEWNPEQERFKRLSPRDPDLEPEDGYAWPELESPSFVLVGVKPKEYGTAEEVSISG